MSYASTHAHLRAELHRVDAIIEAYDPGEGGESPADGASSAEAEKALPDPRELSLAVPPADRQAVSEQTAEIREHCRNTDDTRLRLRVLAETCGLSRRHLDVLMLAVAPELDSEYGTRFQQAHNHQSLARPTPLFVETLFGCSWTDRLAAGALVSADSPLRQHDLIELQPSPDPSLGTRGRLITVTDRIVDYLKGYDGVDPELDATLAEHTRSNEGLVDCEATPTLSELAVDESLHDKLAALSATEGGRYYWYGPGSENHRAVEAVCQSDRLLRADLKAVLEAGALEWLRREAALLGRPLHLSNATAAMETPESTISLEAVFERADDLTVFVTGSKSWTPTEAMSTDIDAIIEFPYPSVDLRQQFWKARGDELPEDVDPDVLGGTFRLTHGQLEAALSTARSFAGDEELTAEDIYGGCSAQSADGLGELAERIEPDSQWDEIQLRAETERKLQLVRTHITQQSTIYNDWGFAEGSARGTGVVALFEGPSGTGKTMAAELLAGDVGMDLYRIDLSSVVSKYIGETEENLEEIFEAATNSNAILLFDEADAVFGDRTEVSDSTDRYANAEVNYLLQRIERYDGIVLLTTNYASQIDAAFQRRLDHTVSFKQPQQSTRNAIWTDIFPDDAPVGEVDYEFLSSFEFTGGQIKTIAHTAAVMAASEAQSTGTIEMRHLVEAIQSEFETSGRMVDPAEYEPYQHLLYTANGNDTSTPVDSSNPVDGSTDASDHSDSEAGDDDRTGEEAVQPTDGSPEEIVRAFFDRLNAGDPAVHDLYHSQAIADRISRKELRRAKAVDHSIASEIERIAEDSGRVRLEFSQRRDRTTTRVSTELRLDDGCWRLFDLQRGAPGINT